jgi:uncharacterized protein
MGKIDTIEPLALAARGRILEGRLPLSSLPRLLPLLAEDTAQADPALQNGEVEYRLEFGIDEGGIPCVMGSVKAVLPLTCQRCMETMALRVSTRTRLGIVTSQAAAEQLPERYDPLLVPSSAVEDEADSGITVASIVEDELILALPQVAMHKKEECPQGEAFLGSAKGEEDVAATQRENPFAVLSQLKTSQSKKDD